jgi:hypothetical protein
MFSTFNLIPLVFTLFTGFGVVVHDTQIDHAALNAISAIGATSAVVLISTGPITNQAELRLGDQHIHTENVSISQVFRNMNSQQPRLQTKLSEDRKYIIPKKLAFSASPF